MNRDQIRHLVVLFLYERGFITRIGLKNLAVVNGINRYLAEKTKHRRPDAWPVIFNFYDSHVIHGANAPAPLGPVPPVRPTSVPKPPRMKKPRRVKALSRTLRRAFYDSDEWRALRYRALKINGAKCQCCGRTPPQVILHVDHVLPRSTHPHLELQLSNLQVLCEDCNLGKSNTDTTDWRKASNDA